MNNSLYHGKITPSFFSKIQETFTFYKEHKRFYDTRIIENNNWYKSRYADVSGNQIPSPTTPYLFNVIANKHADAMDNYPEPNILEREKRDQTMAEKFTKILPLQLELCDFKRTYSRAWWYKLKNGASCYGIFFNPALNHGLGEIDIKKIDLLNLFWEPGITNIQDSSFVFLTTLVDNDQLRMDYPDCSNSFAGNATIDITSYNDMQNTVGTDRFKNKTLVVDCYYKDFNKPTPTLEMVKFSNGTILDATVDNGEKGLYDHGMYPFVFDVMYPDEDSPVGFGLVDIIKNPQLYIDKLDSLISKNALISGKTRYMIKDNGGLNEMELTDLSKDIIHVAGTVGEENIRELQAKPLHPFIVQHRQNKINELKEVSGNRDFQQGDTNGGVTAASAITALQQAGEKLARDMISESYEAYKDIIYLCLELMRQFYDEPRPYRIDSDTGNSEYISFSNRDIKSDAHHRAEFDVVVSAEKNNPYSRISQNQTLLDLWKIGAFKSDSIDQSILLLESMHIDKKEKLIEGLRALKETREKEAQKQAAMASQMQNSSGASPSGNNIQANATQGGTKPPQKVSATAPNA
ncbi:MAG: hypothetical protein RSA27_06570 [Oscillospiraceae bacterium]